MIKLFIISFFMVFSTHSWAQINPKSDDIYYETSDKKKLTFKDLNAAAKITTGKTTPQQMQALENQFQANLPSYQVILEDLSKMPNDITILQWIQKKIENGHFRLAWTLAEKLAEEQPEIAIFWAHVAYFSLIQESSICQNDVSTFVTSIRTKYRNIDILVQNNPKLIRNAITQALDYLIQIEKKIQTNPNDWICSLALNSQAKPFEKTYWELLRMRARNRIRQQAKLPDATYERFLDPLTKEVKKPL